jgi:hypothetical protein
MAVRNNLIIIGIHMKKNYFISGLILALFCALAFSAIVLPAFAQPNLGLDFVDDELGLAVADPRVAAIGLVELLMTFLGIIAVIIILYGGFMWMTAAGNDDRVSTAKKIISAGVIGLVIILAAFLIVNFVVDEVSNALDQGA